MNELLFEMTLEAKECQHSLACDMGAVFPDGAIAVISAGVRAPVGEALRGALLANNCVPTVIWDNQKCHRDGHGYIVHRTNMGSGYWHYMAMSKRPGFLASMSEQNLWLELKGPNFTTPLLREWIPWLKAELICQGLLSHIDAEGCEPGVIMATDQNLDELVVRGVKEGHLKVRP